MKPSFGLEKRGFSFSDAERLLGSGREVSLRLQEALDGMPESFVVLLIVDLKNYSNSLAQLLKIMRAEGRKGVYFTINKPVEDLTTAFKTQKISVKNLFFIDAVSMLSEKKFHEQKDSVLLNSPTDLIEISSSISKAVSEIQGKRFVILDSLSTLLLYNKPGSVEKFVHALSSRLRSKGTKSFLVAVKSPEHSGIVETISQFMDKVVEIK